MTLLPRAVEIQRFIGVEGRDAKTMSAGAETPAQPGLNFLVV